MKWVLIGDNHVNMNQAKFFSWSNGKLIMFFNEDNNIYIEDPDKKHYHKLCQQIGVRPYEEEAHG